MEFNVALLFGNMESQRTHELHSRDIPRGHQPPQDHLGMPEWQRPSQFPWKWCKTKPQCACQPPTPGMTANATCLGVGGASGHYTRLLRDKHSTTSAVNRFRMYVTANPKLKALYFNIICVSIICFDSCLSFFPCFSAQSGRDKDLFMASARKQPPTLRLKHGLTMKYTVQSK